MLSFSSIGRGIGPGGTFQASYRVYPVAALGKEQLENGDKIILPPSALHTLSQLRITYPMLFKLTNEELHRSTHCGVLEFVAEEGVCYIPSWMMQNLLVEEGCIIQVQSATLLKGTFVKFQPQKTEFIELSNPKAVLEAQLRHYSALTKGDTIVINYNGKRFAIDILETKPADAVSIIETDINVDFAQPLDYKEPTPEPKPAPKPEEAPEHTLDVFHGSGHRLDGRAADPLSREERARIAEKRMQASAEAQARLGKAPGPVDDKDQKGDGTGMVFGGSAKRKPGEKSERRRKLEQEKESKPAQPTQQPFAGKGYTLQ